MKTVKLVKKFVTYSEGSVYDVKRILKELKDMGWKKRSHELKRMKEILE